MWGLQALTQILPKALGQFTISAAAPALVVCRRLNRSGSIGPQAITIRILDYAWVMDFTYQKDVNFDCDPCTKQLVPERRMPHWRHLQRQ